MNQYTLQVWTGPCSVREIACKLRAAGVHVVCEGTERVIVRSEGSDRSAAAWNVLANLMQKHGADYGLRPKPL